MRVKNINYHQRLKVLLPSASKPRISWPTLLVLPDSCSCLWRNSFIRASPRPLSSSPWVNTPSKVDFPASTFPTTAILQNINKTRCLFVERVFASECVKSNRQCENTTPRTIDFLREPQVLIKFNPRLSVFSCHFDVLSQSKSIVSNRTVQIRYSNHCKANPVDYPKETKCFQFKEILEVTAILWNTYG